MSVDGEKEYPLSLVGRVAVLARTGLIMGVVVAALSFPLAAVAGLGLKASVDRIDSQAERLPDAAPAQTSRVFAADGTTLISQFYDENRVQTPLSAISPNMTRAIVAAEDARFYDHHGVDVKGVARAFVANRRSGEVSQGASTLTMQYVRNVLRDSARTPEEVRAATEQTGVRKLREIQLAVSVEQKMGKSEILERYLNVVYFGHQAYGIAAAAQVYFSKSPADLSLGEAAMVAGLVQAPSAYDPAGDQTAATTRRNYILDRMAELNYVSRPVADEAKAQPITLRLSEPPSDCAAAHGNWGFFCDLFKTWWSEQSAFGASPQERLNRLRRGGYNVVTSLDAGLQAGAERHVTAKEPTSSPFAHGLVAIEPGTGRVKAMAVNRVYSTDQSGNGRVADQKGRPTKAVGNYPNTVNPLLGGGDLPGFQAGSTFKLFTMLAALDRNLPLSTSIYSPQRYRSQYPSAPGGPASCGTRWCPSNATAAMTGQHTMWSGFGKSVNTYFVQLEQQVGADRAVAMAERLGLRWRTSIDSTQASKDKAAGWGAFTLGVADTTPLEMANAYATIAADGSYCEPLPVLSITGPDGKPVTMPGAKAGDKRVEVAAPRCRQALRPEVARAAVDAARCTTGYGAANKSACGGWSTAPTVYPLVKRPVAGKTGTTDNNQAAWFVGITPSLAVASFIADPDNPLHAVGAANHNKPIQSAAETLRDAVSGGPVRNFTPPAEATAYGPKGSPTRGKSTRPGPKVSTNP
ncbi:transglycosylase domain-containing protein [Planosporangium mesophilum]|uniref:Penicillin-binding protein n=1 Tax=Planosporangium mesophilum TaxID=689768 RepID=A0A8J3TFF5_9ACTN|nr:transglycosylase domain-containing protein [Planosporangium mesophilum]NJC85578.1 penicillin-binding protein [Planosporangium mesophilum]GII24556.1 penicillin-binding protein [Planosporangium mesophilum]